MLGNIGGDAERRASGLNTSVGWRIGDVTVYVLEGGALSGDNGDDARSNLWTVTAAESFAAPPLTARVDADVVVIGGGFTG